MDELIYKFQAIDAVCTDCCGGNRDHDCRFYPDCDNLKSIKALPTVQPKHGKWHTKTVSYIVLDVCDQCMRSVRHVAPLYDYCPHCGAKMEG